MSATEETEFERQQRVVDQMLSQHSLLRDRYDRFGRWLDVSGIVLSAVLTAFSLMKDEYWSLLGTTPPTGSFVVALVAAGLFGLSIVQYRVQWKEKTEAHGRAARILADWKAEGRLVPKTDSARIATWIQTVAGQLPALPSIPDSMFLRLKATHLRKRQVSRRMDSYPGSTSWLVSLRIRITADAAQLMGRRNEE